MLTLVRKTLAVLLLGLLLASACGTSAAGELRPFVSGSYSEIVAAREGQPFLLVLWSIDCPPCYEELAMLGALRREHGEFELVLVAADRPAVAAQAQRVLEERGLVQAEAWIFAASSQERLRFEIDPAWYGELPRSYLFSAAGKRRGMSGRLKRDEVIRWLDAGGGARP